MVCVVGIVDDLRAGRHLIEQNSSLLPVVEYSAHQIGNVATKARVVGNDGGYGFLASIVTIDAGHVAYGQRESYAEPVDGREERVHIAVARVADDVIAAVAHIGMDEVAEGGDA